MPMLIPPKPWVAPNIGGHISQQSLMMRVRGSAAQVNQLFAKHKDGKLEQVSHMPAWRPCRLLHASSECTTFIGK